jgi:hypothetical protein
VRQRVLAALVAAAGLAGAMTMAGAGPAAAAQLSQTRPAAAARWGQAALLPGAAKLGEPEAFSVSCPSVGNCTAGGGYADTSQVFVISERHGRWGLAQEVPGLGALNTRDAADLAGLSCASPGNCVAAGAYLDNTARQGFIAVQRNWSWGKATSIPGLSTLDAGNFASVQQVSCGAAGNCTVGGSYVDASGLTQAFLASSSDWHWAKAIEVPGTAGLNAGGQAELSALSCRTAGSCSAAGGYRPTSTTNSAFVLSERNGHWGSAVPLPGLAALNAGGDSFPDALACGSPGNCVVGGSYRDAKGHTQAFVAAQSKGSWQKAAELRGTGALNAGGSAQVTAVSCPSAGNCSAGGFYTVAGGHLELFVAAERAGTWGKAIALPGLVSHNPGGGGQLYSLSCASAGNCSAGGYYLNAAFREFAFVDTEEAGHWGSVTEVPGLSKVSGGGDSGLSQLSCPAVSYCVGVGYGNGGGNAASAWYVRRT